MHSGIFVWTSYKNGKTYGLRVRECPDPAAARVMLERDVVEGPVEWKADR